MRSLHMGNSFANVTLHAMILHVIMLFSGGSTTALATAARAETIGDAIHSV